MNKHRFIRSGLVAGLLLLSGLASSAVHAAARSNTEFRDYMFARCQDVGFVTPPNPTDPRQLQQAQRNFDLCNELFPGSVTGEEANEANIVVFSDMGGSGGGSLGGIKGRTGTGITVGGSNPAVSAGAEDGGFGFLLTTLSGDTDRIETELTGAFTADLSGFVAGVDYNFADVVVLGLALGSIEDEARLTVGGGLETESTSQTLYATITPMDGLSFDVYFGNADSEYASARDTNFGFDADDGSTSAVQGTITGSYEGTQDMNGLSINYDLPLGDWSLGVFAALDNVKTKLDAYDEQGTRDDEPSEPTGLELSIPAQQTKSATTSYGLRVGYGANFEWGTLLPTLKYIAVKENESDAREIDVFLVADFDPQPFTLATDEPDRDFSTTGASLIFAFNSGLQVFLDYEQRSGHDLIDTSSLTLGGLYQF